MSIYKRVSDKISNTYLQAAIAAHNVYNGLAGMSRLKAAVRKAAPPTNFRSFHAAQERAVEILDSDRALTEVIFSCYFVHQADPILGVTRRTPDIGYIAPWYDSIKKLNVTGIIIHDGLPAEFIAKYRTEKILFRRYTGGHYSIFEERWFAFYLFLSQINITRAFISDINDVYITKDPFQLKGTELTLYVGRDQANKIKDSGWLLAELKHFEADSGFKAPSLFYQQDMYNAGISGGSRQVLLLLMSKIITYTMMTTSAAHKDMTLLNLVIYDYFFPIISRNLDSPRIYETSQYMPVLHECVVTGYPLNSDFQKYQLDSDAYFIHK